MEKCVKIFVDGKVLRADPTNSLLHVLRDQGRDVPSLCYHPTLEGYGSCGLCMVEVYSQGIWKTHHACILRPTEGMQIRLETPDIIKQRAYAAQLLLRRGPFRKKGIEELLCTLIMQASRTEPATVSHARENLENSIEVLPGTVNSGCILCGLCIRTCCKIGKERLTFLRRGNDLCVGFVLDKNESSGCGNCRACSHVCPAGFITPDAQHAFKNKLYSR